MFKKLFTIFIIFTAIFFSFNFCLAEDEFKNSEIEKLQTATEVLNPGGISSPQELVGRFIKFWIAGIGMISLVLVVVAGIYWMTASGNPEKVKKASSILVWSIFGVVAIFLSYLITTAVFNFLAK